VRVLVTGAGGQLGRDVVAACEGAGDDVVAADRAALDVTDRDAVLGAVLTLRPDVVVHTAAWTAVDACEAEPDLAYAANALAVRWVAEACSQAGAHLVHVSTDYVFSGDKAEPYVEWDEPAPRSVYGASKRGGEVEAFRHAPGATVVRTSWVCGEHGTNMVKTVLTLAAQYDTLTFVDDQRGHPTFTSDLAPMVRRLAVDRRPGLYHVTNQGAVSWYEFVGAVLQAAGHDPERVVPIPTVELQPPRPAPRPANSVLDNAALRMAGLPLLPDFHDPLERLVKALL
jgi:dTDP-4-dehydrorhamnose reductase